MGASFAKMEAPLDGSADDGSSSLLPPAARAGMTVRIKKKRESERIGFLWSSLSRQLWNHHRSHSRFCFSASRFLRRLSVPHFCLLSLWREAFNSSECSGCSILWRLLRADLEWNSRRVFIIIVVPLLTFFLLSLFLSLSLSLYYRMNQGTDDERYERQQQRNE